MTTKIYFTNQNGAEAILGYENGWYYLTIGDRVSQSLDMESRIRILTVNGYFKIQRR